MKTLWDFALAVVIRLLGGFDWLYQVTAGLARGAIAGVADAVKEPRKVKVYGDSTNRRKALTADLRRQLERMRANQSAKAADASDGDKAGPGTSGGNGRVG